MYIATLPVELQCVLWRYCFRSSLATLGGFSVRKELDTPGYIFSYDHYFHHMSRRILYSCMKEDGHRFITTTLLRCDLANCEFVKAKGLIVKDFPF